MDDWRDDWGAHDLSRSHCCPRVAAGIGYAIAERLGLAGAHVIICSRGQANVDAAVSTLRARGITVTGLAIHVGSSEARSKLVAAAVAAAGRIDILVSNVAVNPVFGPMMQVTDEKSSVKQAARDDRGGGLRARSRAQPDEARVAVGVVDGLLTGGLHRAVPPAVVGLCRPATAVGTRCST